VKIRELVAALAAHDTETEVLTEGCDCWGEVESVRVVTNKAYKGPHVILVRPGHDTAYQEDYEGAADDLDRDRHED